MKSLMLFATAVLFTATIFMSLSFVAPAEKSLVKDQSTASKDLTGQLWKLTQVGCYQNGTLVGFAYLCGNGPDSLCTPIDCIPLP